MLKIQQQLKNPFYIILSLPATAMGFALSVQISALSWILSTQYGLDIHQVGLVWAAGPIAGILGQVIIGIISDNVWFWNGRRRPFILIGGVLAALMLLALPNINVISTTMGLDAILGIAITVALTLDLSINVSFNPTRSIIADVTPQGKERTRGYTWMQTISGSFGVIAYGIGAVWGNYMLIYVGAALVLLLSVVPPFLVEEPRQLRQSSDSPTTQQQKLPLVTMLYSIQPLWGFIAYDIYAMALQLSGITTDHYWAEIIAAVLTIFFVAKTLLANESDKPAKEADHIGFKKILAANAFSWIGIQTMFVFIFAYLQDKMSGLSDIELGQVISISFLILSAVSAVLPALVLEPMAQKIGRIKTHTLCVASMALGYTGVVMFGDDKIALYLLMAMLGIGWAAVISLPFAIMSERVDQSRMGLYMGLFNLSVVLPQLLVSLGVGLFISKASDKGLVFQVSAVSLAISALAWCLLKERAPQTSLQSQQSSVPTQTESITQGQ